MRNISRLHVSALAKTSDIRLVKPLANFFSLVKLGHPHLAVLSLTLSLSISLSLSFCLSLFIILSLCISLSLTLCFSLYPLPLSTVCLLISLFTLFLFLSHLLSPFLLSVLSLPPVSPSPSLSPLLSFSFLFPPLFPPPPPFCLSLVAVNWRGLCILCSLILCCCGNQVRVTEAHKQLICGPSQVPPDWALGIRGPGLPGPDLPGLSLPARFL